MIRNFARRVCLLAGVIVGGTALLMAASTAPIVTHDNRTPAGELRDGVLTIHLELGEGQWHPGSEDGESVTVYAFGETGKPLSIPGPLLRVPQGTEIHAFVHNPLSAKVTVNGLNKKPADGKDVLVIPPGETKETRFQTGEPGTYFYWATTTDDPIPTRTPIETELGGAFIIDPPGATPNDRIFVLGLWFSPEYRAVVQDPNYREIPTINGKLWPYTERFTFHVGEPVHWRWVNQTVTGHSMHLHGFYFNLDAMGTFNKNTKYTGAAVQRMVTHHVNDPETFDMSWTPDRPGRWLMHCHMVEHMEAVNSPTPTPFAPIAANGAHHHGGEPDDMAGMTGMGAMSGMILGITVLPDQEAAAAKPPVWKAERKLQLVIDERKNGRPSYALTVREAGDTAPIVPGKAPLIGPPIILTRGQPVEIEVVNHMKGPTAIHWHGIELESYYDGVPGWTGTPSQVTPPIAPGKSFVARMIPPRAGTFIYHTHYNDTDQIRNGVYGPIIILPPGEKYDPEHDKTFVVSMGTFEPFGDVLLINGNAQPKQIALEPQTKYHLRFINITPDEPGLQIRMWSHPQYGLVQWKWLAKDGENAQTPAMQKADFLLSVGETYDFEYTADKRGETTIDAFHPRPRIHATQNLVFGVRKTGVPGRPGQAE